MRRCKKKYFSELVYEGKRSCKSTLGRLAKVLGKVNGNEKREAVKGEKEDRMVAETKGKESAWMGRMR